MTIRGDIVEPKPRVSFSLLICAELSLLVYIGEQRTFFVTSVFVRCRITPHVFLKNVLIFCVMQQRSRFTVASSSRYGTGYMLRGGVGVVPSSTKFFPAHFAPLLQMETLKEILRKQLVNGTTNMTLLHYTKQHLIASVRCIPIENTQLLLVC